jgi:WD40 repeat protein
LLISSSGGVIGLEMWDWRSTEPPAAIERAFSFEVSPDRRSLATLNLDVNVGGDADAVRVYDLTDLERFSEFPINDEQLLPTVFHFSPHDGILAARAAGYDAYLVNFWDLASTDLVAAWEYDQEYDETGMDLDLNSAGFTPDGYFLIMHYGELATEEAQPEALWQCGFALADVGSNQIFFHSLPMPIEECEGSEYLYILFGLGGKPFVLSPDGRYIVVEDGFGSLRVWGIDAGLPSVPPTCSGDC